MNYSHFYSNLFRHLYITRQAEGTETAERVRSMLPHHTPHIIEGKDDIPEENRNAASLFLTHPLGRIVGRCPGSSGHLCCNYLTVNLYIGCTVGCSYCIMKWYLNFEPITVVADPSGAISSIEAAARENPGCMIRVGTGEVGDSLLLDPLCGLSHRFVESLAAYPNVYFELKTKTTFVDHLLSIRPKGNAVIAFSLNPKAIVEREEPWASPVEDRFKAAERAVSAGFLLAFHFDPVILVPGWEEEYLPLVDRIGEFDAARIAWISLGTFRYPPELKSKMEPRPYLFDEFVKCRDGKYRYVQKKRIGAYRFLADALGKRGISAPVYMCMESPAVWKAVFGGVPPELTEVKPLFIRPTLFEGGFPPR